MWQKPKGVTHSRRRTGSLCIFLRGPRGTLWDFCLRIIVNETHINLERTTCSVLCIVLHPPNVTFVLRYFGSYLHVVFQRKIAKYKIHRNISWIKRSTMTCIPHLPGLYCTNSYLGMLTFSFFRKTIVSLWKRRRKIENETIVFLKSSFLKNGRFYKIRRFVNDHYRRTFVKDR